MEMHQKFVVIFYFSLFVVSSVMMCKAIGLRRKISDCVASNCEELILIAVVILTIIQALSSMANIYTADGEHLFSTGKLDILNMIKELSFTFIVWLFLMFLDKRNKKLRCAKNEPV